MIKFVLLFNGCKNFDTDYFPKSVIFPYEFLVFGSGYPITSNEFLIAWDYASNIT